MRVRAARRLILVVTILCGAAQAEPPTQAPLRGPQYHTLRWMEDFSYLDREEGTYQQDLFDPIKNIQLDDWRLDIGGSLRVRLESRTNNFINLPEPSQDTTLLQRYLLHADLRHSSGFRLFVEGIHATIDDNDSPDVPINENRFDFQQYFMDLKPMGADGPLTVRVGRQELLYGKQRLISPLDWSNTRRRFDGFKVMWHQGDWKVDAFYVHTTPAVTQRTANRALDQFDGQRYLLGTYATYSGIPRHGLDLYYFYLRNANAALNADGDLGALSLNTVGTRFWGKTAGFDYDTELAFQFGNFASDTVTALAWTAEGGYTFDADWSPRIGLGVDYASGDSDPTDGRHERFNQLFPLGHAYLGYIDLVARQNIWAGDINLTVKPHKDVTIRTAYQGYWLAENTDGLFNAGGVLLRRDALGSSSNEIGQELDVTVKWRMDTHSSMLVGYSHFWSGAFLSETGQSDDADFFYVQYNFSF